MTFALEPATSPFVTWHNYANTKPKNAGFFLWKVPSRVIPELVITFIAEYRTRSGGKKNHEPDFHTLNGRSLIIPEGTEWRHVLNKGGHPSDRFRCIEIDDETPSACPFCGSVPRLTGAGHGNDDPPHLWTEWSLKCCAWTAQPEYSHPRDAIRAWNIALSQHVAPLLKRAEDAERKLAEIRLLAE